MQFGEVALVASKAKINIFEFFKKALILAQSNCAYDCAQLLVPSRDS